MDFIRRAVIAWGGIVIAALVCAALVAPSIAITSQYIGLPWATAVYCGSLVSFIAAIRFVDWLLKR